MAVKVMIGSKGKSAIIAAERSLFGRLLILTKFLESLSLEFVLGFSLSPKPWSLGLPDSPLFKICKVDF